MTEKRIYDTGEKELYKSYPELLERILSAPEGEIDVEKINELADSIISTFESDTKTLLRIRKINQHTNNDYVHAVRVAVVAFVIGKWNNYEQGKLRELVLSGLLHDIGKEPQDNIDNQDIDNNIMKNIIYKRHPIEGYEKLASLQTIDDDVLRAVLAHHEKCDGTGFPLGLKGKRISDIAKVVALANEYDRLRQRMHIFDVVKELRSTHMGAFELDLLINFCSNVMNRYIGNEVLLSTGEIAVVKEIQPHAFYRPIVAVGDRTIDLYVQSTINIEKVY